MGIFHCYVSFYWRVHVGVDVISAPTALARLSFLLAGERAHVSIPR